MNKELPKAYTITILSLLLFLRIASSSYAQTIYVNSGQSIQEAINNQAVSGDTVFVYAGTYVEDIVMKNGVDLKGESYALVTIKGKVYFKDVTAALSDVTIVFPEGNLLSYINLYYEDFKLQDDAGVTVINSTPTIQNCLIIPDLELINNSHPETPDLKYYGKGIQIWNMYNNPGISPYIENNIIRNTECGIYYFSQAFGGAILGEIKNNILDLNNYGIVLRMHNENPAIYNNIITRAQDAIYFIYNSLLQERLQNITYNSFGGDSFDTFGNVMDIWCEQNKYELEVKLQCAPPTSRGGGGCSYWNNNIDGDPLFVDPDNYDYSLRAGSPCIGQADNGGDIGAQLVLRPSMPRVSPLPPPSTNQRYISIEGTKDPNTSIIINRRPYIDINSETTWSISSYDLGEYDGNKRLYITSKNINGKESVPLMISITLDRVAPEITIISPLNGATIDTAPITVSGTINEPCDVIVNGVLASVEGSTFTAEGIDLRYGENTITAAAYDYAGNFSQTSITVTSTATSDYNIIKLTPDVYEYDPTEVIAGSQVLLTIRLEIDGAVAESEPIEFLVTQGSGSMVQPVVNTDANGEATGILNTDANASVTSLVEVFDRNFPDKKVIFHIDTKEGMPANLVKLTDDSIRPAPGAEIDLAVKLEDANNNLVPDEEITYQIISGPGSLSSTSANTNEYGNAKVKLTTTTSPSTLCTIEAQSTSNPSLTVTFNITTSGAITVTVDDVIAKVIANDQLIQDTIANITVTSNAPWAPPIAQLKIWQKGDKQKVQEISPEPGVYIRPPADTGTPIDMTRTILSYDPATDIYVIKSVQEGQTEEYPGQIDYVDYTKGVVIKTEYHLQDGDYIGHFVTEYSDFININGIWGFQTMVETTYDEFGHQLYKTTSSYSNIQLNTGMLDSEFE